MPEPKKVSGTEDFVFGWTQLGQKADASVRYCEYARNCEEKAQSRDRIL
jgi:hypothetical protein